MGLLKKITRPISKVLDKIVPNEIKPFLPYAAALAPFYLPPGMQMAQSGIFSNPMFARALVSGGLNLGSQLSQEGSEGDFNPFSVAMASGVGALGAQNAPEFFQGMQRGPTGVDKFGPIEVPYSDTGIMASVSDAIGKGGASAAKFIGEAGKVLRPGEGAEVGLNIPTLEAVGIPLTQGTSDLAFADAQRALRDYENEMANQDHLSLIDDDGRRRAIRAAMEAAGHLEEIIVDTLAELGLKQGGIVGLKKGGRIGYAKGSPNFGVDRYFSEMLEEQGGIMGSGEKLLSDAEKAMLTGEYPDPEDMISLKQRYESIQDKLEEIEPRYTKDLPDKDKVDPYYVKKVEELMKKESKLDKQETKVDEIYSKLDVSGITRSPGFQIWLELYEAGDPKAKEHPYHEVFEDILYQSGYKHRQFERTGEFAKGGVASVLPKGKEADYRGGGVIPVGSRERADDVPARLSKNEFVMTADAVRAAGGGSINKGAKRMYNLMHNLEARV